MFTFVESPAFARVRDAYLDDDEYREVQEFLMSQPEAGSVIPGSGGVRKVRWRRPGTGKSGGLRVIYFARYMPNEFWMLTLYAKAKTDRIPPGVAAKLKEGF